MTALVYPGHDLASAAPSNNRPDIIGLVVTDPREYFNDLFAPLCAPVYDALEWGAEQSKQRRAPVLLKPLYDWLGTHSTRAFAHSRLAEADLGDWKLTGNHRRNGELWLANGMTRARILHTNSETRVPRAGHNGQRRAYYRNIPLFNPEVPAQQQIDFEQDASKFLVLWRVVDPITFEVAIRVVRPLTPGSTHEACKVDIDFMLPRLGQNMLLTDWFPSDDDIQLPGDEDDLGEEASGDGNGMVG